MVTTVHIHESDEGGVLEPGCGPNQGCGASLDPTNRPRVGLRVPR
jgi:hypothetical protein